MDSLFTSIDFYSFEIAFFDFENLILFHESLRDYVSTIMKTTQTDLTLMKNPIEFPIVPTTPNECGLTFSDPLLYILKGIIDLVVKDRMRT
jgi:hypothetical protein